ncbi:hypothetical protein AJ79_08316 [Helicocarpus griseus UAMH5409]|uniref:Phosphoribosylaminoimidazole-succinocarboxamide synthase n=1 Tax=Helicocarpus griseus UAMH5409 TaxID=1447875 RepID=A0A2B7WTP0_9EURO|nr:hypothetical protein AJ79_08316 [Helicocarpus griseus UAMH5409]
MTPQSSANLRSVKSNQPQLIHSSSQQSIAASDDYYSFSDVSQASNNSKVTVVRYETPPTRRPSPSPNMISTNAQDYVTGGAEQAGVAGSSFTGVDPEQTPRQRNRVTTDGQDSTRAGNNGTPTPGTDDMPYIRFAIDQLTRDEELSGQGRHGSVVSTEYPVERIVPHEGLGYYTPTATRPVERPKEEPQAPERCDSPVQNIFTPITPPEDGYRYPRLNFIPFALRPFSLISLTLICLAMMAALIFCIIWSDRPGGLWAYDGLGGSRYFVFQFLPQLLAIIITICLFVIQSAVYRILPLTLLVSGRGSDKALQSIRIVPHNFILPDISLFRHGEILTGTFLVIVWAVNIFTVPLQSSLFVARFYGQVETGEFRWSTTWGVAGTLTGLYGLLVIALLGLMFRFNWRESGLLWDPVCLADIIPLIQRSNVLEHFERTEILQSVEKDLLPRRLRLGYWSSNVGNQDILYAIGEENVTGGKDPSNFSHDPKRQSEASATDQADIEQKHLNTKNSFERSIHSPFVRYRWTAWFLKDTCIVAWIAITLVLMIAFIVVTFVKHPIREGFVPLLPTLPSSTAFSSSNFLYSFIPAFIGTVLFLLWQPIDQYFRAIQPFSDLSSPDGAYAESSLLLSYPSNLPFQTTILALTAGHYKVAYISFMGVASLAIPVLGGGIFMARTYTQYDEVRISTFLPAYYTLMAFVIIYALSFLVIWPRRKRYLPHAIHTYADIISFLYQSPLLSDKVFREPRTKADLVTRVIVAPPGEGEKALYAFGIYHGRDGKEHLGIDRLRRVDQVEMFVAIDDGGQVV